MRGLFSPKAGRRGRGSYHQMIRQRAEMAQRKELERAREENRKRTQEIKAVQEVRVLLAFRAAVVLPRWPA